MLHLSEDQIKAFQQKILTWYSVHQRDLPWRKTRNPYNILISEVMSQQTQISRVIPKYETWMRKFPMVIDLANASTADVLIYWSGLGYNRRALYLQKTAQMLVKRNSFQKTQKIRDSDNQKVRHSELLSYLSFPEVGWPQTEEELMQLPGIGEYTARAILCFAFDQQIAVVDTNVRKVILTQFQQRHCEERGMSDVAISQIFAQPDEIASLSLAMTDKDLQSIADQLLPQGQAYEWNQALMDYSAAVLKKEKISIPRQSKFKDSDRYYRGRIIKLLIQQNTVTSSELYDHLNKEEQVINQERLGKIIDRLLKDKLIAKNNETIVLP